MDLRTAVALAAFAAVSAHAATFTVTNKNDSGPGSLRDAVAQSNGSPPPNTIVFDGSVTGTIVLTSGQLAINQALTITGPGATNLTIDANANSRIFSIFATDPACPALDGPDYLVTISGLRLTNARRTSSYSAGAIFTQHSLTLDSVQIDNSVANSGGGLVMLNQYPGQALTITNSQFLGNRAQPIGPAAASVIGGALAIQERCSGTHTSPVPVVISNSTFSGNQALPLTLNGFGGAIYTDSFADFTITDSRIVDNQVIAPNPSVSTQIYRGGGIYGHAKSLTIIRSEISGNGAIDLTPGADLTRGGGLSLFNTDATLQGPADVMTVKLINSTVSNNSSSTNVGAIFALANVVVELYNSTVANNSAAPTRVGGIGMSAGNLTNTPPTLTLVSSILADNADDGYDFATNLATLPTFTVNATNSVIGTICPPPACGTITVAGAGNQIGVDPKLGPLAYNGGPTRTHALRGGSPAIGAGSNPLALTTDQRGGSFARVVGAAADMGAFEAHPLVVTNNNDSGAGSLRDAVAQANVDPGPNVITFDTGVTGTILLTSGQLNINGALSIAGPGSGVLTIDGSANSRVFSIFENVADVCATPGVDFQVSISGLTLNNGLRGVANSPGGALYSEKTLLLDSVVISNSQAFSGGGMHFNARYSGQSLTIVDSQFLGNVARPLASTTAGSNGGGLRVAERCATTTSPVTVTITNSLISGNQTQPGTVFLASAGGGVSIEQGADITITNTRIVGNSVVTQNPPVAGANNRGGGLSVDDGRTLTIERSEIANNSADRAAGIRILNDLPARQTAGDSFAVAIVNSTISGNAAVAPLRGAGGIGVYGNVALELYNSTLAANSSAPDAAGGMVLDSGVTNPASAGNTLPPTVTLQSSIVADSLNGAPDIAVFDEAVIPSITVNASQSLVGSVEPIVSVVGSGNVLGVNPMLGPLAFNGGSTRTMALLAGSPAINTGSNPLALTTDQRGTGFPRVVGSVADMGAYESTVTAVAPVLQSAVSRRTHGAAGSFDQPLTLTAVGTVNHSPTTEPRQGPSQSIVFTFDKPIAAATVTVTEGTATAGAPSFSGNTVVVGLSGVSNQQYVTVTLTNVASADGGTGGSGEARVGFLLGDASLNRVVTVSDLGQVNAQIAQVVTGANFLKDVNASGTLTVADKGITNAQLTKALPTP